MRDKENNTFAAIRQEIANHPSNKWAKELGYRPIYTASERSRIVIIGQAPGRATQASHIPWDDASGKKLREWLDVSDETFYDPDQIALIPMDFYYPGKGTSSDLPPRKEFAPLWHPKLFAHMPNVQLTILIGQYAQKHYLGKRMKRNLTETVHCYEEYLPEHLPIVHSSPLNFRWHSKNPWFEESVVPDLQKIVETALLPRRA